MARPWTRRAWRGAGAVDQGDIQPIAGAPYLIVRWDNRWEESNQNVFGKDSQGTTDTADDTYGGSWFETVVGVVVTTAP